MLVRQLEEELRMRMRQPNIEMQQQMEAIYGENEHLQREIAILRDTIKVSPWCAMCNVCARATNPFMLQSTRLINNQPNASKRGN